MQNIHPLLLGKGSRKSVYLEYRKDDEIVAIATIHRNLEQVQYEFDLVDKDFPEDGFVHARPPQPTTPDTLVMDLVSGITLDHVIRKEPMPVWLVSSSQMRIQRRIDRPDMRLLVLSELAVYLSVIHDRGACHGAIKGSKFMLDCVADLKLLPFGVQHPTTSDRLCDWHAFLDLIPRVVCTNSDATLSDVPDTTLQELMRTAREKTDVVAKDWNSLSRELRYACYRVDHCT